MKNYVQPGNILNLTAPAGGLASGQGHLFGALFGIATTAAPEGQKVAVSVEGVFALPKATGSGLAEGQKVYWDATAKKATAATTDNTMIGHAVEAAATGATMATVRLAS
jgi:predicted RecA/RadA family phage recombinase